MSKHDTQLQNFVWHIISLYVIILFICDVTDGYENSSDAMARLNNVLKTYAKHERPNFGGPPAVIWVQVGILQIGPVDEKDSTFSVDIYFRQTWKDHRLSFGGNHSITINADPHSIIWAPDTTFPNSVASKTYHVTTVNSRIVIGPDGLVYNSQRISLTFICHLDLKSFPIDIQKCDLNIESYSFPGTEIIYKWITWHEKVVGEKDNFHLDGYHLDRYETLNKSTSYNGEPFSWLVLSFTVSRIFNYYLFHYYGPSGILVFMTWATFWIPREAAPARVALIVTTLLSSIFIAQNGINQVVRTSYRTSLEVFFTINIVYIVMSMTEYLLVINLAPRYPKKVAKKWNKKLVKKSTSHLFKSCQHSLEESQGKENVDNNESSTTDGENMGIKNEATNDVKQKIRMGSMNEDSHYIDVCSRVLFPLSYALALMFYFLFGI